MKTVKILSFVAGMAILLFGCSKGSPGISGPAGAIGPIGTSGFANVKIHVYTVDPTVGWTENAKHNLYYAGDTATSSLTDTVNETVTVFFSTNGTGPWTAMPCLGALNAKDTLTYSWSPLAITFIYKFMNPAAVAPAGYMYFDVAVIPPAIMKQHPGTNWKDGNAVLNLPEVQAAMKAQNQ